jgi:hypothetical protein
LISGIFLSDIFLGVGIWEFELIATQGRSPGIYLELKLPDKTAVNLLVKIQYLLA